MMSFMHNHVYFTTFLYLLFQSSKSELQLHRSSHQYLENQSLVMASNHYKSEGKLMNYHQSQENQNNCQLETQTEVSMVTGVEYGGHQESTDTSSTVLKGVLWQQRDKVFSRWKERYFVLTADYLQCFKKSSPSVMHSAASEMGRFIFKLKLTEVNWLSCISVQRWGHKVWSIVLLGQDSNHSTYSVVIVGDLS